MKKEYVEKFKKAKELIEIYDTSLSEEENDVASMKGYKLIEELISTQDSEVLCILVDLFNENNENGVCETLENDIYANFTMEQIIYAIGQKFDYLIDNAVSRLAAISRTIFYEGYFLSFRQMFNNVASRRSERLLTELDDWCDGDFKDERDILREDMKKW